MERVLSESSSSNSNLVHLQSSRNNTDSKLKTKKYRTFRSFSAELMFRAVKATGRSFTQDVSKMEKGIPWILLQTTQTTVRKILIRKQAQTH